MWEEKARNHTGLGIILGSGAIAEVIILTEVQLHGGAAGFAEMASSMQKKRWQKNTEKEKERQKCWQKKTRKGERRRKVRDAVFQPNRVFC
jgi:hypothetical protein